MEKSSLGKILLALSVLSLYVFLFGIMDVIEPVSARVDRAAETSESEPSSKGAEETDEPAETPAFTIDTANRRKPGLADYGVPVLPVTPEPFSEVTEPLPETSGETETPAATPEETPLIIDEPDEPDETRTETAKTEEGTSAPETSAPVEPPASEKLSVISGGEIVEGDANDI
ncbi:MAG: hypothetical protein LBI36_04210, partial [Oscillospiraceae bacterium]|nr:hypothetical protein [Oscillospiraceae bacterium]